MFADSKRLYELLKELIPEFSEFTLWHQHMLRTQVELGIAQNVNNLRVKMIGICSDWVRLINGAGNEDEAGLWITYRCNLPAIIPTVNVDRYRMFCGTKQMNFIGWCRGGAAGTVFQTALIELDKSTDEEHAKIHVCGHVTGNSRRATAAGSEQVQWNHRNVLLVLL